jgi:hypothetical protein
MDSLTRTKLLVADWLDRDYAQLLFVSPHGFLLAYDGFEVSIDQLWVQLGPFDAEDWSLNIEQFHADEVGTLSERCMKDARPLLQKVLPQDFVSHVAFYRFLPGRVRWGRPPWYVMHWTKALDERFISSIIILISILKKITMTTQVLIHLPTDIAKRFREAIPARQRSLFVSQLLEKNLPDIDEHMYQLGLKAEQFDQANPQESQDIEVTLMDGLDSNETFDTSKLSALCQK